MEVPTGPAEPASTVFQEPLSGVAAWTAAAVPEHAWRFALGNAELTEIGRIADQLRRNPVPLLILDPMAYDMTACRSLMERVRGAVFQGVRFAVVDRLPLEEIGDEVGQKVYWLLSSLVAPPVAQKLDGSMLFDVRDYGLPASPGSGIRPAQTNLDLAFHNDNAYNERVPEVVALLCLRQAKVGGISRTISFHSVHNRMLEKHRALLPRLYETHAFDRQRECWPDESPYFVGPVFRHDGQLSVRMSSHQMYNAYAMQGRDTPGEVREAMTVLEETCREPDLSIDFKLERGMLQFVNNRQIGHARTDFAEFPEQHLRRHLVRLWLRRDGMRSYTGR